MPPGCGSVCRSTLRSAQRPCEAFGPSGGRDPTPRSRARRRRVRWTRIAIRTPTCPARHPPRRTRRLHRRGAMHRPPCSRARRCSDCSHQASGSRDASRFRAAATRGAGRRGGLRRAHRRLFPLPPRRARRRSTSGRRSQSRATAGASICDRSTTSQGRRGRGARRSKA